MIDITGHSGRELSLMFANDEMMYRDIIKCTDWQEVVDLLTDYESAYHLRYTKTQYEELMNDWFDGAFQEEAAR